MIKVSTSFEIFPTNSYIPNNEEVILLSQKHLKDYLKKQDIILDIKIKNQIRFIKNDILTESELLIRDKTKYESFIIDNQGQALLFYQAVDDISKEFWEDEIKNNIRAEELEKLINKNIMLGYSWSVKRTMGQPAIVNIYYGYLAIAIAELTNGIIYSDDGAWEYECFPATADNFKEQYLDLSKLKESTIKEFINWCLKSLKTI